MTLKIDLNTTRMLIDRQIDEVFAQAKAVNLHPTLLRDVQGAYLMTPLLIAKSNVLLALSNLERK